MNQLNPSALEVFGSKTTTVDANWEVKASRTVLDQVALQPLSFTAACATAGSESAARVRRQLGVYVLGTDAWTPTSGLRVPAAPWSFTSVYTEVTVALSAATRTLTLRYTNQDGVTGRTATATMVSSAVVGQRVYFVLQAGDTGVQALDADDAGLEISGVQTGTVAVYGDVTLGYVRHLANQTETQVLAQDLRVPAGFDLVLEIKQATGASSAERYLLLPTRIKK